MEDELFSPALAYVSLLSVLQGNERAFGTSTVRVERRLDLSGGREVRVDDLFAEDQPSMQAAGLVAAPLAYLMANDFEKVSVEKLDVEVSSFETIQERHSRAGVGRAHRAPAPGRRPFPCSVQPCAPTEARSRC